MIKSKRTILMIGVVLAALLAGAIACTVSLYRHSETLTSTIETLQRENDTMEQQLLGSTGETPEQPEETTSAPTLTAEPSKAEQAAMDAVSGYMYVLNQVTSATTLQQQMETMGHFATGKARQALWGDGEIQSDAPSDGETVGQYSQTCTAIATYATVQDATTIDVFGVYGIETASGDINTSGTILVTARCILQGDSWLVDEAKQVIPSNLSLEDFYLDQ